jgi:formylglycine-generating enzyme required for sulfatase activity
MPDLDSDILIEEVEGDEDIGDTHSDFHARSEDMGEGADEVGLPESPFEGDEPVDPDQKARLLAEAFDGYLGAMERYYNQYLLVPEGTYLLGGTAPLPTEKPQSHINMPPFYVGKFPVTNALFEVFVERTGYVTLAEERGHSTVYHGRLFREKDKSTGRIRFRSTATLRSLSVPGACWYRPTGPGSTLHQKRNHPVVHVALEDALAFAAWTGKRLPTEAEWEAAARTQRGFVFPWGNDWKGGTCNMEDEAIGDTTPVDAFKEGENELGIADTLGNVLEWTSDICSEMAERLPAGRHHILKGGSWTSQRGVRLTNRFKMNPELTSNIVGFRCAVD